MGAWPFHHLKYELQKRWEQGQLVEGVCKTSLLHHWEHSHLQKEPGCQLQLRPRQKQKCRNDCGRQEVCLSGGVIAQRGRLGKSCCNPCLCLDELCVFSHSRIQIYSCRKLAHERAAPRLLLHLTHCPSIPTGSSASWPPRLLLRAAASHLQWEGWERRSCRCFSTCSCLVLCTHQLSSAPFLL